MTTVPSNRDPWRWPTLALWVFFFLLGLYPGLAFQFLRDAGHVNTWNALVNSEHLITLMCAGFLAFFVSQVSQRGGMDPYAARARGLVVFLLALTAFLPIRLDQIALYARIPVAGSRHLLYLVATTKCLAWLYLLSLLIQYYLVSGPKTFYRLPTILPSVREHSADVIPMPSSAKPQGNGHTTPVSSDSLDEDVVAVVVDDEQTPKS